MARSKDWRNHPKAFFDVMRALRDNPKIPVEIECATVGEARSKRLDLNSFKHGCVEAGFVTSFKYFGDELPLWCLPQLEVLVRDNPPRVVVQCKDYSDTTQAIENALAKRKQQMESNNG